MEKTGNQNDRSRTRRGRRYFVGLVAGLVAIGTVIIAGPAGAVSDQCDNSMNPAKNNFLSSGLIVACTFTSVSLSNNLTIDDYQDVVYHAGAARKVRVTISRANGSAAGKFVVTWCPNGTCPGNNPNLEKGPSNADVNHSMENPNSTAQSWYAVSPLPVYIDAGTFVTNTTAATWTLSRPTLGGPVCANGSGTCPQSLPFTVLIDNHNGRTARNGMTQVDSGVVTSANVTGGGNAQGMHFCRPGFGAECTLAPDDTGAFLSGGDLPDGARIFSVDTKGQVTLDCTSKVDGVLPQWGWGDDGGTNGQDCTFVGTVTNGMNLVLTLTPFTAPTSTRFVTDGSYSGAGTITSVGAKFAKTDIGLPVFGTPTSEIRTGSRIATVAVGGGSATITAGQAPGVFATGTNNRKFTIGVPTKTAPATGDVVAQLAAGLSVNNQLSPTSPPCAANKISGFQVPLVWRNPAGNTPNAMNGYDLAIAGFHVSGVTPPAASVAQLDLVTSTTTFAGYVTQTVTIGGTDNTTPTTTAWGITFTFLPVAIGVCPATSIEETLNVNGISLKQAKNPPFTGGSYGAVRALLPEVQSALVPSTYTGAAGRLHGAHVHSTALPNGPATENNTCKVASPNIIKPYCQ